MGTGGFAEPPKQTAAYRRGYLCGLIRGDGNAGHYSYPQLDRPADRTYLFRLPLAGQENREGLTRTAGYLARAGIGCVGFSFAEESGTAARGGRRELTAVRTGSAEQVRTLSWLLDWPEDPGPDWHKGFLAGIFDAHGSYRDGVLLLAPADPAINGWLVFSLESLGFGFSVERPAGRACVRVRGGLAEALRFFHTVDPAVTARRSIEAAMVETGDDLRVAGIERLGLQRADVRHHHRDRRLHRQRRGESQLLRQEIAHLPGPRRGRGLQHPGRGQGERARAGPQEDGLAELAAGAHLGGHERGLLPAGGGTLPADARHHPRAQRRRQPVLHPDQGHPDPQGHRTARRGGRGHRGGAQRVRGLCRQRPLAINRAGHARTRAAARGVRGAERARAALRRAHGPGGAVPVRLPRPARRGGQADRGGRCHARHRPSCCTCARARASGSSPGCGRSIQSWSTGTSTCTAAAPTPRRPTRTGSQARSASSPKSTASAGRARRRARPPGPQRPQAPGAAQTPVGRAASHGAGETRLPAPESREPRHAPQTPAPRKRAAEPPEQLTLL